MSSLTIFADVAAGCAAALALAVAIRARRSATRWAFVAGMAVLALECLFVGLAGRAETRGALFEWQTHRLVAMSALPGAWVLFSLVYARGNAREFVARVRVALGLSVLAPAACWYFRDLAFAPGAIALRDEAIPPLGLMGLAAHMFLLIGAVWIVMNLERTLRAAVGTIRWRIKFMIIGVGVVFVTRIFTASQALVFRAADPALDTANFGAILIAGVLIVKAFARAGHFDLDVYPSRSVLQSSVTVLLAGIYLLIVGVLARVVSQLGGDAGFALKAFLVLVSLVGLTLALQSDRVRWQLRRWVTRHFRRPAHDYRGVWQKFTEGTVSRVEQAELCRSLVALVAEILQALSVSVWVTNEKRDALTMAASTSVRATPASEAKASTVDPHEIAAHFAAHQDPIDLEGVDAEWAATLRRNHAAEFTNGGNRVCVPMLRGGDLLGLLVVGDRVSGEPFSPEDFDVLKCLGDHAAASLLNVQLSKKLLQAKELEAFQAMAAFFVHDLKNAASTLNLMLQNLPVHFDDPEFRQDALRGIAKTVAQINGLIGRLGVLRTELKVELAESDLNDVVANALAGLQHMAGAMLVQEMTPVPRIPLDRVQLNKVITNLVLNATEAAPRDGRVRVATGQQNGWIVLTVDDNGCGMSQEFVAHSLFRPFQTTKKNGLGIGMFQSKMIVEAHGGRIAVASAPGKGTTFQVFLRAPASQLN